MTEQSNESTSARRLYRVTTEVWVVADDEYRARDIARREARDIAADAYVEEVGPGCGLGVPHEMVWGAPYGTYADDVWADLYPVAAAIVRERIARLKRLKRKADDAAVADVEREAEGEESEEIA